MAKKIGRDKVERLMQFYGVLLGEKFLESAREGEPITATAPFMAAWVSALRTVVNLETDEDGNVEPPPELEAFCHGLFKLYAGWALESAADLIRTGIVDIPDFLEVCGAVRIEVPAMGSPAEMMGAMRGRSTATN